MRYDELPRCDNTTFPRIEGLYVLFSDLPPLRSVVDDPPEGPCLCLGYWKHNADDECLGIVRYDGEGGWDSLEEGGWISLDETEMPNHWREILW